MGLFGGSKSSSSTYNVNEEINKSYGLYGDIDGPQSNLFADIRDVSGTVNLSALDGGAIGGAFNFAENSLSKFAELYDNAMSDIDAGSQRETETAMFALNKASTLSSAQLNTADAIKWGGIILAVGIIAYAIRSK